MKIAIVAGEPSGDVLAAGLMSAIKRRFPETNFFGIGGERMLAEGLEQLFPMDSIALMGVESVIRDLRNILAIRRQLRTRVLQENPDCFIGVDVPDFNISLEKTLRCAGIRVVHYVSPSVWAWRGYRIRKIRRAVDHILTLFPFEKKYYDHQGIAATFVGHPSATRAHAMRAQIDISEREQSIALLPGSRSAEVNNLLPVMLEAATLILRRYPETRFVLPFASQQLMELHQERVLRSGLPIKITLGQAEQALGGSHLTIVASGTAALEAMMFGSVMVVVYKLGWLSAAIFNLFKHVEHFSLPNHLLSEPQIPELAQGEVTADNIFARVASFLDDPERMRSLGRQFEEVAARLDRDTDRLAADAVLSVISDA